jgi:hypothetical protein
MDNSAINLRQLASFDNHLIAKIHDIYLESFPRDEQRDFDNMLTLANDKDSPYELLSITDHDNLIIGLLSWWNLSDFIYIEHFAIANNLRGKGIGTQAIELFTANFTLPIIVEVEPPTTQQAIKRINFYSHLEFVMIDFEYIQPPYSIDLKPVPLKLMILNNHCNISPKLIKERLYKTVYKYSPNETASH